MAMMDGKEEQTMTDGETWQVSIQDFMRYLHDGTGVSDDVTTATRCFNIEGLDKYESYRLRDELNRLEQTAAHVAVLERALEQIADWGTLTWEKYAAKYQLHPTNAITEHAVTGTPSRIARAALSPTETARKDAVLFQSHARDILAQLNTSSSNPINQAEQSQQ